MPCLDSITDILKFFLFLGNIRVDKEYKIVIVLKQIWLDFKTSLSNKIVLKKSIWYIFGMAAYVQVPIEIFKKKLHLILIAYSITEYNYIYLKSYTNTFINYLI